MLPLYTLALRNRYRLLLAETGRQDRIPEVALEDFEAESNPEPGKAKNIDQYKRSVLASPRGRQAGKKVKEHSDEEWAAWCEQVGLEVVFRDFSWPPVAGGSRIWLLSIWLTRGWQTIYA